MERIILSKLNWDVDAATPLSLLNVVSAFLLSREDWSRLEGFLPARVGFVGTSLGLYKGIDVERLKNSKCTHYMGKSARLACLGSVAQLSTAPKAC